MTIHYKILPVEATGKGKFLVHGELPRFCLAFLSFQSVFITTTLPILMLTVLFLSLCVLVYSRPVLCCLKVHHPPLSKGGFALSLSKVNTL